MSVICIIFAPDVQVRRLNTQTHRMTWGRNKYKVWIKKI